MVSGGLEEGSGERGRGKTDKKRVGIGKGVNYPENFLWEFSNNCRSFKAKVLVYRHCHISGMTEYLKKLKFEFQRIHTLHGLKFIEIQKEKFFWR